MERRLLKRELLEAIKENHKDILVPPAHTLKYPEKVVQFGGGNFVRAFADYSIQEANNKDIFKGRVVVVQSTDSKRIQWLNAQDGLSTLLIRGIENKNKRDERYIVGSISRGISAGDWSSVLQVARQPEIEIVLSNTTEAGIVYLPYERLDRTPPVSFPGKLAAFLFERYKAFGGSPVKGLLIIPLELIENNAGRLRQIVLRLLEEHNMPHDFINWVKEYNTFCGTLVDRIVTGKPEKEGDLLPYEDNLLNSAEPYLLWVIEDKKDAANRFPLDRAGLNIHFVPDIEPYRQRKVRILNASHTALLPGAFLSGLNYVRETVEDPQFRRFWETLVFTEILPVLPGEKGELEHYAGKVAERFLNPFIKHRWLDIALNTTAKVSVRLIPTIKENQQKFEKIPLLLSFSLAAYLLFYRPVSRGGEGGFYGQRLNKEKYLLADDAEVLNLFFEAWQSGRDELVTTILGAVKLWGEDLTTIPGLVEKVCKLLTLIEKEGIRNALHRLGIER